MGSDIVQSPQRRWGDTAEKMLLPHRARHAIIEDVETIRSQHAAASPDQMFSKESLLLERERVQAAPSGRLVKFAHSE